MVPVNQNVLQDYKSISEMFMNIVVLKENSEGKHLVLASSLFFLSLSSYALPSILSGRKLRGLCLQRKGCLTRQSLLVLGALVGGTAGEGLHSPFSSFPESERL